jgi:CheY-like chemotaxis protein
MSAIATEQRILIIDDDELSRDLLTFLLEAEGYLVESVASGDEALERPAGPTPDIILTDFQIPGIAGNALALRLREVYGTAPQVLAMSGTQVRDSEIDHFDAFLLKPFSTRQLQNSLKAKTKTPGDAFPEHTDSADTSPLNEDIYRKLRDYMSGPELLQMYNFCLQDSRQRLERMQQHTLDHDHVLYSRAAHNIKGSCGMLGATELREIAGTMESFGLTADIAKTTQLREQFLSASQRLESILEARTDKPS